MKKVDYSMYVGKKFGRLLVISILAPGKAGIGTMFHCKCDCGNRKDIRQDWVLRDAKRYRVVRSCGCLHREMVKIPRDNLIGRRFGRLMVTGRSNRTNYWMCKCDCGKEKEVFRGSLTSGLSKSCGCNRYDGSWIKRGAEHHSWNPAITDEDRQKRKNHLGITRRWSKAVFCRDNWTCQACGRRGSIVLHAHHIESWNSTPNKRFDIGNGITMCIRCHIQFHRKYGKGDNTFHQWKEFRRAG